MAEKIIASALRTLAAERDALGIMIETIGSDLRDVFTAAIETFVAVKGRIIITGMGKSGHIARKIAATMASTGTPAFYVHPAEASHGDLGMVLPDDGILALSWSGETAELADIVAYAKRFRIPLVAITSNAGSALGRQADYCLALPKAREACPNGLAPTTSTTMQLAMGDAIAVAMLERRGFTAENFKVFHPGGKLGAQLRTVREIMHTGASLPLVRSGTLMETAIREMSAKGFGSVIVTDTDGRLTGIITDGDLRRHIGPDFLNRSVDVVMSRSPKTVTPDTMLAEALEMQERSKITALIVAEDSFPVGLVHYLDLLRAGVA